VLGCLRAGADDAELQAYVARIWAGRLDRYSDDRAGFLASGEVRPKIEMSYIGG
jgi:cyclic pyranopterin phosphate synthase